jgi:hypothetical protein
VSQRSELSNSVSCHRQSILVCGNIEREYAAIRSILLKRLVSSSSLLEFYYSIRASFHYTMTRSIDHCLEDRPRCTGTAALTILQRPLQTLENPYLGRGKLGCSKMTPNCSKNTSWILIALVVPKVAVLYTPPARFSDATPRATSLTSLHSTNITCIGSLNRLKMAALVI